MIRRTFRIALLPVALGAVVALGAAPGGAAPTASSTPPTTAATPGPTVLPVGDRVVTGGITREVLASVAPPNAPGTALYLTRVRIAPGSPPPRALPRRHAVGPRDRGDAHLRGGQRGGRRRSGRRHP